MFPFLLKEGREWCRLCRVTHVNGTWQARQHSCCRVFKSYDLTHAFTHKVGTVWNCRGSQDCLWKSTRQGVHLLLAAERWAGQGGGTKRGCNLSSPSPFSTENVYHKSCTCGVCTGEQGAALAWSGTA